MLFFFTTHVRPIIEYASCIWNTGYIEDVEKLECVQRRWTKQVEGMGELPYSERLKQLNLYSVQGRLLRADLLQYWKIFHGKSSISADDFFRLSPNIGTRGHSLKLQVPRANTDVRKRSFSYRQVLIWNSLPEKVVAAPNVSAFKRLLAESIPEKHFEYV